MPGGRSEHPNARNSRLSQHGPAKFTKGGAIEVKALNSSVVNTYFADVKPPLAETRGFLLNRLAVVTPAVLRRSWGLSTPASAQPRGDWHDILASDRSDGKSGVRKGKALPARRFESVRRHLQKRFRTSPSRRGLDRIETVIQDKTGKKGAIENPPDARPIRELAISLRQRASCVAMPGTFHRHRRLRA
jgi:hypothetical protein